MPTDEQLLAWWIYYYLDMVPIEEITPTVIVGWLQMFHTAGRHRAASILATEFEDFKTRFPKWQDLPR